MSGGDNGKIQNLKSVADNPPVWPLREGDRKAVGMNFRCEGG